MINNLTKEDIKNSVEFRWRKSQLLWLLGILTIITVVMLLVLVLTSLDDLKYFILIIKSWLIVVATYSVLLFPLILYYAYKMLYILKHYKQFNLYEVILDDVSTSYAYRGAVYYTVTIFDDDTTKRVCTNPYFSSRVFANFTLEEYNNKKIIGLYDNNLDKFYIIKKVN